MTRRTARSLTVASLALAWAGAPGTARAQQTDTNPPLPNVLLLIDNSGSMDRMIDGTLPETSATNGVPNACNCTEIPGSPPTASCNWSAQPGSANRWGVLTQALTGSIQGGYNCVSMPRTAGSTFTNEYEIGGVAPYDTGYYLNDYRPVAEDLSSGTPVACVYAPGYLPGANPGSGVGPNGYGSGTAAAGSGQSALDFPPNAIVTRPYGQYNVAPTNSCTFAQYSDGIIPTYTSMVRFGMMTFDNDPSEGIGVTTATPMIVLPSTTTDPLSISSGAFTGMWSYFPNWSTGGQCTYLGNPADCSTSTLMAVGSRNPAAPPWEGRMVMFPTTNDLTTQEQDNTNVSSVINSTRPYGATPLAGMFVDAQYYFWQDPNGPQMTDPLVQASVGASANPDAGGTPPCREQYIVLMTDGAPNMDMRPDCSNAASAGQPSGTCPFPLPETTAATLYAGTATGTRVTTFVIGFAVSSVQDGSVNIGCSTLVTNGSLAAVCNDSTQQSVYGPCCELQRIAIAGSGGTSTATPAFFADTPGDLQAALGTILSMVSQNATTRTVPAYSPSETNSTTPNGSGVPNEANVYLASFDPSVGLPWTGDIVRERYDCTAAGSSFTVPAPTVTPSLGDDFADNVNSNAGSLARTFVAFEPGLVLEASGTSVHDGSQTNRPYITGTAGDGFPISTATTYAGPTATLVSNLTPDAFGITNSTCQYVSTTSTETVKTLNANDCMTAIIDYETAQATFGGSATDFPFVSRAGRALGDIYHATPIVVGPPDSLLQDPLYTAFQSNLLSSSAPRKNIVYAASNDGLLHAFWADENQEVNNEYWAMLPPAVMQDLPSSYPSSHEFLLDGSPIVKDVVWDRNATSASSASGNPWHTMLVAGFGEDNTIPGYYAVDVSQPDPGELASESGTVPSASPPVAPVFRWQLTTVPSTNFPILGTHSGTPAIATLFMDPGDGGGARDIGVAVLPGGQSGSATTSAGNGSSCTRWADLATNMNKYTDSAPLTGYTARTAVQCWGSTPAPTDPVPGRALIIARLDTGEILRVFTRKQEVTNLYPSDTLLAVNRITDVPFDSPIVGTPVIYPSDVGTDTTKIFVGDADGTLWRIDVSDPEPANWTGGLYLDAYNQTVDTNTTAWSDGQPFGVSPTLSLDPSGELVMNAATTTTDEFDTSGIYFLYSITEKIQGTASPALRANVNWYMSSPLTATTATTAPLNMLPGERVSGPMTVFNGELYFATYAASSTATVSSTTCSNGLARVWGVDYVTPYNPSDLSQGGAALINGLAPTQSPTTLYQYVIPSQASGGASLTGVVIPGVSIRQSPACASTTQVADPFTGGQTTSVTNFAASTFSLFAQLGQSNPNGLGANTLNLSLSTPFIPTTVNSWAAVFE